jgi:hypothetical protein
MMKRLRETVSGRSSSTWLVQISSIGISSIAFLSLFLSFSLSLFQHDDNMAMTLLSIDNMMYMYKRGSRGWIQRVITWIKVDTDFIVLVEV